MNINYKLDNDVLFVSLVGRLDTEASAKLRFLHLERSSVMTFFAKGAQLPFSMRATVRLVKPRWLRWSMNWRMGGNTSAL